LTTGMSMRATLTIEEVAKAADVEVETVMRYISEGLVPQVAGFLYPPETIRRVRFVRGARDLGFTSKEIWDLLSLRIAPGPSCTPARAVALGTIETVEDKIAGLQKMRDTLDRVVRLCSGNGPTSECTILDLLDEDADR
jgi:MerR family transcriptional regulator, copper efflux regulator